MTKGAVGSSPLRSSSAGRSARQPREDFLRAQLWFKREEKGPTVELVRKFTSYCFSTRDKASAIGREGIERARATDI